MKKFSVLLLALALLTALAACGHREPEAPAPTLPDVPPLTEKPEPVLTEAPTEETRMPTEETIPPTQPAEEETEAPTQAPTEETEPAFAPGVIANTPSVNVRKGPSVNTKIVRKLKQGDAVKVYEAVRSDGADWGRIEDGWVALQYIKVDGEIPRPHKEGEPGVIYNTDKVNVRKEPSLQSEKVGQYQRNEVIYVLEITRKNGARWGRTELGWVSMDYVQVPSDSSGGPLDGKPSSRPSSKPSTNPSAKPSQPEATDPSTEPPIPDASGDSQCQHDWYCINEVHPTTRDEIYYICQCGQRCDGEFGWLEHMNIYFMKKEQGLITQEECDLHSTAAKFQTTVIDNPGSRTWQCQKCGATKTIAYEAEP